MKRTNTDNQQDKLREKIKFFFASSIENKKDNLCPIRDILSSSLDKWSLFIIYNLGYHRLMRFNALKSRIGGISSRMLSVTLKRLEKNDLVVREVFAEVPPRVEYALTDFGRAFADRLINLSQWYMDNYDATKQDPSPTSLKLHTAKTISAKATKD